MLARQRTFRLVVLGLPLMLAPAHLTARSNIAPMLTISPAAGTQTVVGGVLVTARVTGREGKRILVAMTAKNPSPVATETEVKVAVFERPSSSMMARIVPPPIAHGEQQLVVKLEPGQTVERQLVFETKLAAPKGSRAQGQMFASVRSGLGARLAPRHVAQRQARRVAHLAAHWSDAARPSVRAELPRPDNQGL
jgi:hypothetical protein